MRSGTGPMSATVKRPTTSDSPHKRLGEPPAPVAAASGSEVVPTYRATQNELKYIEALYEDARADKLSMSVVSLVDCIQLRKVSGQPLIVSKEVRAYLVARAKEFDVDPVF